MIKKRVLLVSSSLVMGGLEKCIINLCDAIDYDKYDVDLYLFNEGRTLLPKLNKNVKLLPESPFYATVYNRPLMSSILSLITKGRIDLAYYRILRFIKSRVGKTQMTCIDWKYMKRTMLRINDEYDVAIGFEEGSAGYYVAECVSAKVKSCWIHTDIKNVDLNSDLNRRAFEKMKYICTVSQNALKSLAEQYPEYQEKYRYFILPALYDYSKIDKDSLKPCNIDKNKFAIVSVGRLVELKGFQFCVSVLKRLLDEGYKVKWYIAGEGEYRRDLETLIQKHGVQHDFVLLGNCDNPYSYIKNADICVQPSSYEGFSVAVWEEKYLMKAVIATKIPANHEMLTDGINGLLVERNSDEIFDAVKYLLDHPDKRKALGEHPANIYATAHEIMSGIYETFQ